ncbi:pyridoxamine 5'-phosphate oxidase [Pseudohyphozyma bogoriensis]|nr:pyridoxamine 5'-phosphate oxidase [Pseudohyphozyma bogoriensis]
MTSPPTPPHYLAKIDTHTSYLSTGIPIAAALNPDPLEQFSSWFAEAVAHPVSEPEAVAVSTVSPHGIPSTRVVLMKRVDERGFVFFTNYDSRKGRELFPDGGDHGAYASMAFYWREQSRSVRVVGRAEKTSPEETKEYFDGRPLGSKIGAWASAQSSVLVSREELEERVEDTEAKFGIDEHGYGSAVDVGPGPTPSASSDEGDSIIERQEVPVPPFWGGVRIVPFEIEFWAGRESRLHDRFRFTRAEGSDGPWKVDRLSP